MQIKYSWEVGNIHRTNTEHRNERAIHQVPGNDYRLEIEGKIEA